MWRGTLRLAIEGRRASDNRLWSNHAEPQARGSATSRNSQDEHHNRTLTAKLLDISSALELARSCR